MNPLVRPYVVQRLRAHADHHVAERHGRGTARQRNQAAESPQQQRTMGFQHPVDNPGAAAVNRHEGAEQAKDRVWSRP